MSNLKLFSIRDVNTSPLLSVVIPLYNHEDYIEECLLAFNVDSILSQIELIIVDDGSTDGSVLRAKAMLDGFNCSHRIYCKGNNGLTDSLNIGLGCAKGKYFSIIASDDKYNSAELSEVLIRLRVNSSKNKILIYQAEYFHDKTGLVYEEKILGLLNKSPAEILREIYVEYPKPLLLQSTIFESKFLQKVNPWSDRLILDDWPTFIRCISVLDDTGDSLVYTPSIKLCCYRFHSNGVHNNMERQLAACVEVANIVVPEKYRRYALSNIYIDRSLNYLARKNFLIFFKLLYKGFSENFSFFTVNRLIKKIAIKVKNKLN